MDAPHTVSEYRGRGWRLTLLGILLCLAVGAEGALAAGKRAKPSQPKRAAATAPSAPAPPTWSPEELERRREVREFIVVGVYRPVEMAGRVVSVPREVYLQSKNDSKSALSDLLGRTLEVRRRVPVPTAVGARSRGTTEPASTPQAAPASASPPPIASSNAPPAKAPAPESSAPAVPPPATSATGAVARLRALKKAQAESKAAAAAAAAAANHAAGPPSAPSSASTPGLGTAPAVDPVKPPMPQRSAETPAVTPEIMRPRPEPLPSAEMDVVVGRVQVVEIRGEIAVARVEIDGLGAAGSAPDLVPAEVPAVMAGDLVRFVTEPSPPAVPPPPPPPQALSEAERARLLAGRKKAQAEAWRRKNPRGQYERKTMKWKL